MFAYLIKTYCDGACEDPDCVFRPEPRKMLVMLHLDPTSIVEQLLVDELLKKCEPEMDEDGVIELKLDGKSTSDAFSALEGVFAMIGSAHYFLKQGREGEEKDEFTESELENVDLNI
jgi:hypothetical protein